MNKKQLLALTISVVLSLSTFAQKNEVKAAEKAFKKKDYPATLAAISQAESLISSADAKTQAKYYYLKGMALYADGTGKDIDGIITAFDLLKETEKKSGIAKYTSESAVISGKIIEKINADAYESFKSGQESNDVALYKKAADAYLKVYQLLPSDTLYLYNSAMINGIAKEYKKSIAQYEELLDLGYTGIMTTYSATSIVNGETRIYNSRKDMMNEIKLKIAENPQTKVAESKYVIMIKAIGSNYISLENNEKALEFITKARKENPKDYNLIIEEGNIYFKMGNNEKFLEKLNEAIEINPDNAQLHFNIGILNSEVGNNEVAMKEMQKAIDLDNTKSDYYNALGNIILKDVDSVQKELNDNAMNFAKYDKIKEEKLLPIIRKAMPYIEKAYELGQDEVVRKQLNSIYENLGMDKRVD